MLTLKENIDNLTFEELLQEYGLADFTYIETANFIEELEGYRQKIHQKIKEKQHGKPPSPSLGSSQKNPTNS